MNHPRKKTSRKTSSSENNHRENNDQPFLTSTKRLIYPNVPKRTSRPSSSNDHDVLQTESQIEILPFEIPTQKTNEYSSITSSTNQNAYTRHTLDLITKYTSPQKLSQSQHRPLSPIQRRVDSQIACESKAKRTLSPFDEINQSKRTKSLDDDDDEEDLFELLDHRRLKQNLSQLSSQSSNDNSQRKPTSRKPTVRKINTNKQKSSTKSTIQPIGALIIEPDIDEEEANTINKSTQISNSEQNHHTVSNDPIPSPVRLSFDTLNSNEKQNILCTPTKSSNLPNHVLLTSVLKRTLDNLPEQSSPCSNIYERRFSSTSSNSLVFETPRSTFSRRTTSNIFSSPQKVPKIDQEIQTFHPTTNDMMKQLILNIDFNNPNKIIYDPIELGKKLFYQYKSLYPKNRYQTDRKQSLIFSRYEIEILYPINNNQISAIYACDICLKHFYGSLIAYQRHIAKCLARQPPGKIVFNENDLAIFQIGETKMDMNQRIYIKFLCQISRLFHDTNKIIDDTKINRFCYYILCRRDPILSSFQSPVYRLIGYFSKPFNQTNQQLINNLSCLFILPCYYSNPEYNQLLISFSYFLIRSTSSINSIYSSPARPIDNKILSIFRTYWCDMIYAYINRFNQKLYRTLSLDQLARQTSIHPRDILSTLYINTYIIPHSNDKSSVYLLKNAYRSMTSLKLYVRNNLLFMDKNMMDTDKDKQINNNRDKEEIILD